MRGGSFVNYFCKFDLGADIIIGNHCSIAMNVHFCTNSHVIGTMEQRASKEIYGAISVGDGSWIGCDTLIMPGVNIGKGCVIGAGSLILEDCVDNGLYVGSPAKLYKML